MRRRRHSGRLVIQPHVANGLVTQLRWICRPHRLLTAMSSTISNSNSSPRIWHSARTAAAAFYLIVSWSTNARAKAEARDRSLWLESHRPPAVEVAAVDRQLPAATARAPRPLGHRRARRAPR